MFKKGDAWFRTGDLLKTDQDGLLYFVDRLGDTFRWKSENVSATEVENVLMSSKALKQAVVVGVQVPHHEGRAGFAVLDPLDEYSDVSKHQEILDKIYAEVSTTLPKYSIPLFIKISPIEASHNHKVPKNQFKNQKLPGCLWKRSHLLVEWKQVRRIDREGLVRNHARCFKIIEDRKLAYISSIE